MSLLTYNGIPLPYPFTTNFEMSPIRDSSDTDWYATKFDITIHTLLNSEFLNSLSALLYNFGEPLTNHSGDILLNLWSTLMKHRRSLSFVVGGVEMIPQPQGKNAGTVDVMNGPKPQSCKLTRITDTTIALDYHIIAHYWANYSNVVLDGAPTEIVRNDAGNNVLYNRWSETVDIDNCNYSTRTRQGQFTIRSDNTDGQTADMFRSRMATLSVPTGFTRESKQYQISEDGLSLKYRIVDKERYVLPPVPAFEASGTYTESTPAGVTRQGHVQVRLKGDKATDTAKLINSAIAVGMGKFQLAIQGYEYAENQTSRTPWILRDSSVRVNLFENEVEFQATVQFNKNKPIKKNVNSLNKWLALPITGSSENRSPAYQLRGTAGLLLQAAAYYDPSIVVNPIGPGIIEVENERDLNGSNKEVQLLKGLQPGQAGKTEEV